MWRRILRSNRHLCEKRTIAWGDRGVSLIVVNEHLFGDPTDSSDNPVLRIPDGATNVVLCPPRQSPLKESGPFTGVEFSYKNARFFLGYELSPRAYKTIVSKLTDIDKITQRDLV